MPHYRPQQATNDMDQINEAGEFIVTIVSSTDYHDENNQWDETVVVFHTSSLPKRSIKYRIKGSTAWRFEKMADALDARDVWSSTDEHGFSNFDPRDYVGREVVIKTGPWEYDGKTGFSVQQVKHLSEASAAMLEARPTTPTTPSTGGNHTAVKDEEIPF